MIGTEIRGAVGFLFGFWKYVDSKINAARNETAAKADATTALAALTRQELSDYNLRAAETFATKAGMQEQTSQIVCHRKRCKPH
ncbi:hypothetical protein ACI0FS_14975 [Ochrobactrum quorumnocens]|uniref:hypothetical protein n=1 Tax=Ochrobactrum quorumnocens TaxID=271865 RepID=UPI000A6CB477